MGNDNPNLIDGWHLTAKRIKSPNFNERPLPDDISLLVIHNISLPPEQFGSNYIEDFFCNKLDHSSHPYFEKIKCLEVSSHFLINRLGELVQFVSVDKRAWHAGQSEFDGRADCNDYSIGIELEGADKLPYSQAQYTTLINLTRELTKIFPQITHNRVVGHCAISPGRKTDPGDAFDWDYFLSSLSS